MDELHRIPRHLLENFCAAAFERAGLSAEDSLLSARILVTADARGIPSHGVGRMMRYIRGLESRQMLPDAVPRILFESPVSLTVDANGGMGFPVSQRTMRKVIEKAQNVGMACACVRNSNHFGIAGYYAMMALKHDMIGVAMTNTAALGVPTFARQVMFGTNPLAFCAPADKLRPFVLDMATTAVTRGKLEVYDRLGKSLPDGWAVDATGQPAENPAVVLEDMLARRGGGLLPLGGFGDRYGGHKGYGLAVMVDILCALLAGAPTGPKVFDTPETSARVSHFFAAIRIASFTDPRQFKREMDEMLERLRNTPLANSQTRVFYAGEKEAEADEQNTQLGIPVDEQTLNSLQKIAIKYQLKEPLA